MYYLDNFNELYIILLFFFNLKRNFKTGLDIVFYACYVAQVETPYVTQAGLDFKTILLPQPPTC